MGNKLIYDLDSSNRVLTLFKNSMHGLESHIEKQILGEQFKKFSRKNKQVDMTDKKFKDYMDSILNMVNADFATDQDKIKQFLKQRADVAKSLDEDNPAPKVNLYPLTLANQTYNPIHVANQNQIVGAIIPANFKHYSHCQCYVPDPKYPRPTLELAELEIQSERDARHELARMCILIRKQRIFNKTKEMLMMNKYQDEINLLNKQLTNNSFLWDQLAEA